MRKRIRQPGPGQYLVIVPYKHGKTMRALSYPASGHPLYSRDEAIKILKIFEARRGVLPAFDPMECYAEGEHERFALCDL